MPSDRRTFLGAGLGVTAALASRAGGLTASAQAVSLESLPLPGNVSHDAEARAAMAHDFGRLIHRQPRGVLKPASSADIANLMRWARGKGVKVAARGQGHSIYGRALSKDGIVVDMGAMRSIGDIKQDRIAVDAGATWRYLLDATLARGFTPPVLTNYLGLSVGGTIAVGGIGAASSRHGMQTDNVVALKVVTGEGKEVSCSAAENPDLFDGIRAGLGQCGIVTRATLRLVRAPERIRRFQLFYRALPSLAADQRRVLRGGPLRPAAGGDPSRRKRRLAVSARRRGISRGRFGSRHQDRAFRIVGSARRRRHRRLDLSRGCTGVRKFETLLQSKGQWFNPQP